MGNSTNLIAKVKGQHNLPLDIYVPDFLMSFLADYAPKRLKPKDAIEIGQLAYDAKVAYIEAQNLSLHGQKVRVPSKLSFDDIAIITMYFYTFKNIQLTNRKEDTLLAFYDDDPESKGYGTYSNLLNDMYRIIDMFAPGFKNKEIEEVIEKIERSVPIVHITKERHLFIVKNGIYNQQTKELEPFSPSYVYLTKIPIDYKQNPQNPVINAPDGYSWDVETWIMELAYDADTCMLIWQIIADTLQPNVSRHKSIWLYSEQGNNGKGTLGQLIKNLLGVGNYASLSVADFGRNFYTEALIGAAANIADENDVDVYIDSIKDYKASITGDDIMIDRKYEKAVRIQFFGTNIQMMNGLPKTKDKSDSFYRRLLIVPFLKSFTNNGERKYIKNDYIHRIEVLEYVLYRALNIEFDEYIVPRLSNELLDNYKEKNNPVLEFWNELEEQFAWDVLVTQFVYDVFTKWFERNNPSGKIMSKRTFIDTLNNIILNEQPQRWQVKTAQKDKIRIDGRMDADEPLISEYGLDTVGRDGKLSAWASMGNPSNPQTMRQFKRPKTGRGYVRNKEAFNAYYYDEDGQIDHLDD